MFKLLSTLLAALAVVGMPLFAVLGGISILSWFSNVMGVAFIFKILIYRQMVAYAHMYRHGAEHGSTTTTVLTI